MMRMGWEKVKQGSREGLMEERQARGVIDNAKKAAVTKGTIMLQ